MRGHNTGNIPIYVSPNCVKKRYTDTCGRYETSTCFKQDENLPEFIRRTPGRKVFEKTFPSVETSVKDKFVHVVSVLDDLASKFGLEDVMKKGVNDPEIPKILRKDGTAHPRTTLDPRTTTIDSVVADCAEPEESVPDFTKTSWQVLCAVTYFTILVTFLSLICVFSAEVAFFLVLAMICYTLADIGNVLICENLFKLHRKCFAHCKP